MLRVMAVVVVVLSACVNDPAPPPTPADDADSGAIEACNPGALLGCREAGASCTWCAPVAESCSAGFTPFCDRGAGWCMESVCRSFCSAVDFPRCPVGLMERNTSTGGDDVCICVPS